MANLPVSNVSTTVHTGILSPETRDELVANACAKIKAAPGSFDVLLAAAHELGRQYPGASNFNKYYGSGVDTTLLIAAKEAGFDEAAALGIIQSGLTKGAAEHRAAEEALPANVARRALEAKVGPGSSLETVRSAVYQAVKEGTLTPEQVSGAVLPKVTKHAARDEKEQQARNTAMAKAVTEGIAAALADWSKVDTEAAAFLREHPTMGNLRSAIDKASRPESSYIPLADFERLANILILEVEGIVATPQFELDRSVERELEILKKNPTPSQFKASVLKVAVRNGFVVHDIAERLAIAMDPSNIHLPVAASVIPADSILTVPAKPEEPQGPQPVNAVKVTGYRSPEDMDAIDPARKQKAVTPAESRSLMKDPPRPLDIGEGLNLGTPDGMVRDFGGTNGRTFTPPATPAEPQVVKGKKGTFTQSEIRQTIRRNANISKNHDSLAEMRGIKGGV